MSGDSGRLSGSAWASAPRVTATPAKAADLMNSLRCMAAPGAALGGWLRSNVLRAKIAVKRGTDYAPVDVCGIEVAWFNLSGISPAPYHHDLAPSPRT